MKLTPAQLEQFRTEGWLFLPELFNAEEVDVLRREAVSIYDEQRPEVWREKSGAPRTAFAAHLYNEAFRLLGAHPRMIEPVEQIFGEKVENGRKLVAAGDSRASLQADMDFHSFIYDLSGNPLIAETMRLHWRHLRRAMGEVLRHPGMSISVWKEHGRILEEMIRGDGDAAAELMRRHLVEAYERVGKTGR